MLFSLLLAVPAAASGPATSAEAAAEAAIARVHAVDPQIHAVIAPDPTAATGFLKFWRSASPAQHERIHREGAVVSHISRKTSEMWGTRPS